MSAPPLDVRSPGVHNLFPAPTSKSILNWYHPDGPAPGAPGAPSAVTAVGKPFTGAKGWLVGFGALAVIITLMTDSPQYQAVGYALLVLIIVSYVFASFNQLRSEANALFGTGL